MNAPRRALLLLLLALVAGACRRRGGGEVPFALDAEGGTLLHGGFERSFGLHVPSAAHPSGRTPLLFVLHGGGGDPEGIRTHAGFDAIAERERFIVVYPMAVEAPGWRDDIHWNDGRGVPDFYSHAQNVDDVGFIATLMDRLIEQLPRQELRGQRFTVDPERIYVTGASNGGMMTLRLGCELSERLAGIAPVIANLPVPLEASCRPTRRLKVLMANGDADPLVPFAGGRVEPNGGEVLSTEATLARWTAHNGCTGVAESTRLDAPGDQTEAVRRRFQCPEPAAGVVQYQVLNGGHHWPGGEYESGAVLTRRLGPKSDDFEASEALWSFFAE